MKRSLIPFLLVTLLFLTSSCGSTKKIVYFQNADLIDFTESSELYDAKIMPKDMLSINVSTTDPRAATPFNISNNENMEQGGSKGSTYLVDNKGNINFPVVGEIFVKGLTKNECERLITDKIKPYLSASEKPIVTVRMASYRVTVIGEVGHPSVIPVTAEKMSIVEALAAAGDLTMYGKRDNVLLIREDADGHKTTHRLNLNDAHIITSPYYYLQQNDIVYVEPNKMKIKNTAFGANTAIWFSIVGLLTSLTTMVITIVK